MLHNTHAPTHPCPHPRTHPATHPPTRTNAGSLFIYLFSTLCGPVVSSTGAHGFVHRSYREQFGESITITRNNTQACLPRRGTGAPNGAAPQVQGMPQSAPPTAPAMAPPMAPASASLRWGEGSGMLIVFEQQEFRSSQRV